MSKKITPEIKKEPIKEDVPIIKPFLEKGYVFQSETNIRYTFSLKEFFNNLKIFYLEYEQWFNITFNNNNLEDEYLEVIGYLREKYG